MVKKDERKSVLSHDLSRRDFLKAAMITSAAGLVAACSPLPTTKPTSTLTDTSAPMLTDIPTPTPAPVLDNIPDSALRRPEVIKFFPDVPKSKVVRTRHAGVWDGANFVPLAIRQMLDTSIVQLTSITDATEAWKSLFSPDEHIAIKVNSYTTHALLAMSVCDCLQAAGIPPEQIFIYDRYSNSLLYDFLIFAGIPKLNRDGSGVRCYGTNEQGPNVRSSSDPTDHYVMGWRIMDTDIGLSEILLNNHALINISALSTVTFAGMGISCALKNHFGTLNCPSEFHKDRFARGVTELNALPPIQKRSRLVIGDILPAQTTNYSGRYIIGDHTLLMSFDPVAHDAVALQLATEAYTSLQLDTQTLAAQAIPWLEEASSAGLGTNEPANMEVLDVNLF